MHQLILLHEDIVETDSTVAENFFLEHSDHLDNFAKALFSIWSNPRWRGNKEFSPENFYRSLGSSLLDYLRPPTSQPYKYLVTKTPTVKNIGRYKQYFGDSKLIFIIRDPRDIAESARKTWNVDLQRTAVQWNEAMVELQTFITQNAHEEFRIYRYEDLLTSTRDACEDVLSYLNLSSDGFDWEAVDKLQVFGSSTMDWSANSKPADFNSIGRWSEWSESELQKFEASVAESMRCTGYQLGVPDCGSFIASDELSKRMSNLDQSKLQRRYYGDLPRLGKRRVVSAIRKGFKS